VPGHAKSRAPEPTTRPGLLLLRLALVAAGEALAVALWGDAHDLSMNS
jgi:hypothetical protein